MNQFNKHYQADLPYQDAVRRGRRVYAGDSCRRCSKTRRYVHNHACCHCEDQKERVEHHKQQPARYIENVIGDRLRAAERLRDELELKKLQNSCK